MHTSTKDNKKLETLYSKALAIKSAIPHPRIMGVIRECGGKMHMGQRQWEKARERERTRTLILTLTLILTPTLAPTLTLAPTRTLTLSQPHNSPPARPRPPQARNDFFEAFKNYDEAGVSRRVHCLKYLVLANMLMNSDINPFDSQAGLHPTFSSLLPPSPTFAHLRPPSPTFARLLPPSPTFPPPEAKPYKNDPEILAMTNLVSAYMRNEVWTKPRSKALTLGL